MHAEYEDSLIAAGKLQSAVKNLIDQPSESTMLVARADWSLSRVPYLQTEIGRYYDGPIENIEGFINAWPIDENYIDYTSENLDAGIINEPDLYPVINEEALIKANENGGEKNVSTGFHAMEFLLWGQAIDPYGDGQRSFKDYEAGVRNFERRAHYLKLIADLLVQHMTTLEHEWREGVPGNYRSKFLAKTPDEALADILNGLGNFSGTELSGERVLVPYTTKNRKDQHSCFSNTTYQDLIHNEMGIQNICEGRYQRADGTIIQGPGLEDLLKVVDPRLTTNLETQVHQCLHYFQAIPPPFDQAIVGLDTDPGRVAVKKTLDALQAQTLCFAKTATALGIRLNLK